MMKKYTIVMLLIMAFGSVSYGQYTAVLSNRTASPNDTVKVNLNVTGFTSIASIQFYIQIDPAVLTFQGVTNFSQPGLMVGFINGNTITMVWTNPSPKNFPNGTLLTLNFKYNGLSSPVAFIPGSCEVVRLVGGLPVVLTGTFTDGSVAPFMGNVAQAKLDTVLNAPLGTVTVPLKYTGFPSNVGAITQKISYDPAKMTFVGVTGTGNLSTGLVANLSGGVINITWSNAAGKNINYPGSQFNIIFSYVVASPANVGFSTGCVIETATPVTNIPVTYFHGYVAPPPVVTSYATIANVSGGIQGQTIDVPVTFASMPANTSNFNLNLNFDSPRLSFVGIINPIQPINYNVNGNLISITNASAITPSPSINGQFMVLRFVYAGVGVANITFGSGCQFSNGAPIGVGYTNGSVSPGVVPGHNAHIGFVNRTGPGPIDVPVSFSDMPTNIGAVTMFIGFDAAKLTYTGVINPNNATVKLNGNIVSVAWISTTPTNINGAPFITLQFNYISGSGSNCSAPVYFTDGCQIANVSATTVPVNWHDGGVNVKFKISGTLKYNSDPNPQIPLSGYTVKLMTITDVLVTSASTDVNGYYEFWAPNGNYKLNAEAPVSYNYYSDLDDVVALFDYTLGIPLPYSNSLRLLAGDVNQNGDIDLDDVVDVFQRTLGEILPDYTAPDWIFEIKNISCSCDNLPNQDLMGLNSGNVLGTNPAP